jgi:hypothetical protein
MYQLYLKSSVRVETDHSHFIHIIFRKSFTRILLPFNTARNFAFENRFREVTEEPSCKSLFYFWCVTYWPCYRLVMTPPLSQVLSFSAYKARSVCLIPSAILIRRICSHLFSHRAPPCAHLVPLCSRRNSVPLPDFLGLLTHTRFYCACPLTHFSQGYKDVIGMQLSSNNNWFVFLDI